MPSLIRLVDKLLVAPAAVLAAAARRHSRAGSPRIAACPPPALVAIKLVGMGDAVLMLPALAAARAAGYRLSVITSARCAAIFSAPGVADEVLVLRRPGLFPRLRAIARALRQCDLVLDFEQHVFWSTALAQFAPRRAQRHGFRTASRRRNLCYDHLVDPGREPRMMKTIFDELARSAGLRPVAELLPLPITPAARQSVAQWRQSQGLQPGQYVVIAPGSGATVGFRRLPAATWAEIVAGLPPELPVVLVGTRIEATLAAEIVAALAAETSGRRPRPPLQRLDLRLEELADLMAAAALVIATDSGPMHLAAAMAAPVVGIFGPDTPRRYAPANPFSVAVSLHLPCSPCNNCWVYREASCTNPDRFACVRRLPAAQVLAAARSLLAGASGAGRRMAATDEGAHNQRQDDRA